MATNLLHDLLSPTAAEAYLAARGDRIRTRDSRTAVRSALRGLQAAHPEHRVGAFTEDHLVAYLRNPAWSPNTVLRNRSVLIGFFKWAKREGLVSEDPAVYLADEVRPPARVQRSATWLEDDEIEALLATCPETPEGLRDRAVLALPIYTGLRLSEFAAPPRNHPDRGLVWGRVRRDSIRVLGKGEKWDSVGLSPQLAKVLSGYRGVYEAGLDRRLGRQLGLHDPVLCRLWSTNNHEWTERTTKVWWGAGLGPEGIRRLVHAYGEKIGYPELAPHDLRRTFAYSLKRAGVPIEDISRMMRHENIATTVRYLKHDKSALQGHWAKVGAGA